VEEFVTTDFQVEPLSQYPPHRVAHPVMRQTWVDLSFLHWAIEPSIVRTLVPAGLHLDLHDGMAWIGLVPFLITDLTLPKAPAVPWLSTFPETNVRTYVVDQEGRRGVWFFSLDAARLLAVVGARASYALPYFWAKMSVKREGDKIRYESARHVGNCRCNVEVEIGPLVPEPSGLEVFLTARFRLFAERGKWLLKADIEHQPWKLQQAKAMKCEESLIVAAGLPVMTTAPLVHFGGRVDVMVGAPEAV
jgi:uncharacterized protein